MEINKKPVNVTKLFCQQSFDSGQGPINQLKTKKLFNNSFSNQTNHEHVAHIFTEDNDREIGLYLLNNGEYWLFEDVGGQKPCFELVFVGSSIEEVVNLLG